MENYYFPVRLTKENYESFKKACRVLGHNTRQDRQQYLISVINDYIDWKALEDNAKKSVEF